MPIRSLYLALRKAPLIGKALRQVVRGVFPTETHIWSRIKAGSGKGLWICLDPRFEMEYVSGVYEEAVARMLSLHLRPGSVFYDVGAQSKLQVIDHLVEPRGRLRMQDWRESRAIHRFEGFG